MSIHFLSLDLSCNIPEIPNNNSCVLIKPWHSWNMLKDIQIKPQITLSLGQWGTLQEPEMRFWKMSPEAISRAAIFSCKSSISTLGGLQTGNKETGQVTNWKMPPQNALYRVPDMKRLSWHGMAACWKCMPQAQVSRSNHVQGKLILNKDPAWPREGKNRGWSGDHCDPNTVGAHFQQGAHPHLFCWWGSQMSSWPNDQPIPRMGQGCFPGHCFWRSWLKCSIVHSVAVTLSAYKLWKISAGG